MQSRLWILIVFNLCRLLKNRLFILHELVIPPRSNRTNKITSYPHTHFLLSFICFYDLTKPAKPDGFAHTQGIESPSIFNKGLFPKVGWEHLEMFLLKWTPTQRGHPLCYVHFVLSEHLSTCAKRDRKSNLISLGTMLHMSLKILQCTKNMKFTPLGHSERA